MSDIVIHVCRCSSSGCSICSEVVAVVVILVEAVVVVVVVYIEAVVTQILAPSYMK